jgi:hypothetical protein
MTERASFFRKIAYFVAMAVLAVAMLWLSAPATATKDGGKLSQLRNEYGLAQTSIGEIDPASETIKLATLGLRGIAVNVLWEQANDAKMRENWTKLTAILEQLAKLQPNFITFWKFQAWNLTYNVSVEFDDYKDRYYYVRRGIQFLKEGERYNVDHPQLLWDLGWFIGQKIGRADEHRQYRRLFRDDEYDYRPPGSSLEERDNWLSGKEWYLTAIDSVDKKGNSLGRKSPRDFYSSPAKSQMNYAEAIEEEGTFGDKARRAWQKAAEEWRQFGKEVIEHSTGVKLQLGSQPELEKELAELRAKLDALLPGVREKIVEEKRQALTPDDRRLLDTPSAEVKREDSAKRYELEQKIQVTDREVAERIAQDAPTSQREALQLANDIERTDEKLQYTINYKRDANFDYWQTRADFEQTHNAIEARRLMYDAKRKMDYDASPEQAKELYERGFALWRAVIDEFPAILDDEAMTGEDLLEYIKDYRNVLDQLEETIADDFPLWQVIEDFDRELEFTEEIAARKKRVEGGEPAEDPAATPKPNEAESESSAPATPEPTTAPSEAAAPATPEPAPTPEAAAPEPAPTESQQ